MPDAPLPRLAQIAFAMLVASAAGCASDEAERRLGLAIGDPARENRNGAQCFRSGDLISVMGDVTRSTTRGPDGATSDVWQLRTAAEVCVEELVSLLPRRMSADMYSGFELAGPMPTQGTGRRVTGTLIVEPPPDNWHTSKIFIVLGGNDEGPPDGDAPAAPPGPATAAAPAPTLPPPQPRKQVPAPVMPDLNRPVYLAAGALLCSQAEALVVNAPELMVQRGACVRAPTRLRVSVLPPAGMEGTM